MIYQSACACPCSLARPSIDRRLASHARVASALLLVTAVTAAAQPAATATRADELMHRLVSPDRAAWMEAGVRLASRGPEDLAVLEAAAAAGPDAERDRRIVLVLRAALLVGVVAADIERHPSLVRLTADSFAQAERLLPAPADLRVYHTGERPLGRYPPDPAEEALAASPAEQLADLGGFCVAVALKRCRDANPVARLTGLALLDRLQAPQTLAEARRLAEDPASVEVHGSDWAEHTSVGAYVGREILRQWEHRATTGDATHRRTELAIDRFLRGVDRTAGGSDLTDALRNVKTAIDAPAEDAWWAAVRPLWLRWWEMCGAGHQPPDREAWLNVLREPEGFHLLRAARAEGSRLHVVEPVGAECEVHQSGKLVASGKIPLATDIADGNLRVVVRAAAGWSWDMPHFAVQPNESWTLRVLGPRATK